MATLIPPTDQGTVQVTRDGVRGDIAHALQILETMPASDAEMHAHGSAVVARLRSALAKLDGHVPITATAERPRKLSFSNGDRINDYGDDSLQYCRDLLGGATATFITLYIPRANVARMAAFARGEEV